MPSIQIPKKLKPVFKGKARYRGAYGGRGSGKSMSFASMLLVLSIQKPLRILCAREFQVSIRDSVLKELKNAIDHFGLNQYFDVGTHYLRGTNGSEFLFKGLRNNIDGIKSLSQIDICWVEEADRVSERSWQFLLPTIRKENSEVWLSWNPEIEGSATDKRFLQNQPPKSKIVEINFSDNPWFPSVLNDERLYDLERNPEIYKHIWEGDYNRNSNALVFNGYFVIKEFDQHVDFDVWSGPHFGLDFGFSTDPMACVRCYVDNERNLYISHESYHHQLEIDLYYEYIKNDIPDAVNNLIFADSARPDTISFLKKNQNLMVKPCKKGQGSVEAGIELLKSFKKIIIHPRCKHTANEFQKYSYQVDRLTGDITRRLEDDHNHAIDALRYALYRSNN